MTSKLRDSLIGKRPWPYVSGDQGPLPTPIALEALLFGSDLLKLIGENGSGTEVSLRTLEWPGLLFAERGDDWYCRCLGGMGPIPAYSRRSRSRATENVFILGIQPPTFCPNSLAYTTCLCKICTRILQNTVCLAIFERRLDCTYHKIQKIYLIR